MYKKIILAIFVIAIIISVLGHVSGFFERIDQQNPAFLDSNENNISINQTNNENSQDSKYKIVIEYNGLYTAGYGSANKNDDVTTSGFNEYYLEDTNYVDVGAKKADGGNGELKISIMKGNVIVEEKTTSQPYGEIIINYKE